MIETVKAGFFDEYISDLQQFVPLNEIDYLIMNHTEPDHAGSVEMLLKKIPGLTAIGSSTAITFLKEITNTKFSFKEVGDGDELDLGGKTLQFISAPFLHWPDSMYSYLKEDEILFTCDSFGAHFSDEALFNDLTDREYMDAYRYYFDVIMSPFKSYVLEALDKIKDLHLKAVCPGHGLILRRDIAGYIEQYRAWSTPAAETDERPKIVMVYVSAYGYTKTIAGSIAEGVAMIGDFNLKSYDLGEVSVEEVLQEIESAQGLLIGSSTMNGDALPPVWELLIRLSPIEHGGKMAAAFGAYGWSGEAVPNIESRLQALRMEVVPGLKIRFKPSERNLEDAFTFGMDFAREMVRKQQNPSKKRWRCLVCGEIHEGEEPPAVCPACGVGPENFVEMPIEDEFKNDTQENFVIIGGGIAGISAAGAIRKRNATAMITVLTEESVYPYYRPALSDYLSEDLEPQKFFVYAPEWYIQNNIKVRVDCRVQRLDPASRTVLLADGENLSYDKLIIASGARSNIPPIKGADQEGVYALRNFDDAKNLKAAMKDARRAVVIGGGVLGLEAVWEMVFQGMEVAVVEFMPRILPRQMDESSSRRLEGLITAKGAALHLGVSTEEIIGQDGRASGVRLSDGQILPADLVLLSTGTKPNVELAQEAGINVERGIVVDAGMRTSASNVFAAGDVAQFGENLIGLWPVSIEMGKIAGAAAAGDWVEYKPPVLSMMLVGFDYEIFSIGDVNVPPDAARITETFDPVEKFYKKSFMKDGVLVGEIIIAPKVNTAESMKNLGRDASGKRRTTKWKCRVCGYIHEGPEPPDECPVCGAPKELFDPI